jgi:RNA polymerase sigma-70 factor (ECF subfamily)
VTRPSSLCVPKTQRLRPDDRDDLEDRRKPAIQLVEDQAIAVGELDPTAAKMCGCPTGTMKSRVNRARAELAQLLSIEGPEDFEEDRIISAIIVGGGGLATGA